MECEYLNVPVEPYLMVHGFKDGLTYHGKCVYIRGWGMKPREVRIRHCVAPNDYRYIWIKIEDVRVLA